MKIKGLSKIIVSLVCMQDDVNDLIDANDPYDTQYDRRDEYLNDVFTQLDSAIGALREIPETKLTDY